MAIPKDIRNQLAKTQGYLHKGDVLRSLDSLSIAASLIRDLHEGRRPIWMHGLERQINALLERLCATPLLFSLLNPLPAQQPEKIQYHFGKEGALATVLRELAKILREQSKKNREMQQSQLRLQELVQKGYDLLHQREYDRGNAFLERAAHEFYTNSTVLLYIADMLMQHGQYLYAMKIMSESLINHPKNELHYLKAMEAALAMSNYAQIEHIYSLAQKHLSEKSQILERMGQLRALAIPEQVKLKRTFRDTDEEDAGHAEHTEHTQDGVDVERDPLEATEEAVEQGESSFVERVEQLEHVEHTEQMEPMEHVEPKESLPEAVGQGEQAKPRENTLEFTQEPYNTEYAAEEDYLRRSKPHIDLGQIES